LLQHVTSISLSGQPDRLTSGLQRASTRLCRRIPLWDVWNVQPLDGFRQPICHQNVQCFGGEVPGIRNVFLIRIHNAPPRLVEPDVRPSANREAGIERPGDDAALR